jgi:arylsulfatase A-like enzyme
MAPHAPYDPSPPFFGRFLDTNEFRFYGHLEALRYYGGLTYPATNQPSIDKWRLRYDEWIAQADEAFGTFVSELDRSRKLADTAVLISADHGESFDGGLWGHNTPVLLRPIIHVPLLVRVPGQANGRVDAPFDHTDLAPTILHLAGLPQPAWMKGQPLSVPLETLAGRQRLAFTQHVEVSNSAFRAIRSGTVGVMDERFQYVLNIATGKGSLFHLAEAHRQTNDIGNDNPQVAAAMRDAILSRFPDLAGNDA